MGAQLRYHWWNVSNSSVRLSPSSTHEEDLPSVFGLAGSQSHLDKREKIQNKMFGLGLIHTGWATRHPCKLERFSFDVACEQCEHSHWQQQVLFAGITPACPVWIRPRSAAENFFSSWSSLVFHQLNVVPFYGGSAASLVVTSLWVSLVIGCPSSHSFCANRNSLSLLGNGSCVTASILSRVSVCWMTLLHWTCSSLAPTEIQTKKPVAWWLRTKHFHGLSAHQNMDLSPLHTFWWTQVTSINTYLSAYSRAQIGQATECPSTQLATAATAAS